MQIIKGILVLVVILGALYLGLGVFAVYMSNRSVPNGVVTCEEVVTIHPDLYQNFKVIGKDRSEVNGVRIRVTNRAPYAVQQLQFRVDFFNAEGQAIDNREFSISKIPNNGAITSEADFQYRGGPVKNLPAGWTCRVNLTSAKQVAFFENW